MYADLGDKDQAFQWLNTGCEGAAVGSSILIALPVPIFVAPELSPLQRNWYCSLNSIRLHCKYSKSEQENRPERSVMKFAPGDLVRNISANLDGRVIEAYRKMGRLCIWSQFLLLPPVGIQGRGSNTGLNTFWTHPRTTHWMMVYVQTPSSEPRRHEDRHPNTMKDKADTWSVKCGRETPLNDKRTGVA